MNILNYLIKKKISKEIFLYKKKILHITDTPDVVFPYLNRLIRIVKPDVIIHTGDLVDNIKLEMSRSKIDIYEKNVKKIMRIMRQTNPEQILITMGNHDDRNIICKYLKPNEKLLDIDTVNLYNKKYMIGHIYSQFENTQADFKLFGHCPDQKSEFTGHTKLLNGLFAIHVIDGISGDVSCIDYPRDTDYFRQKKFKLGF